MELVVVFLTVMGFHVSQQQFIPDIDCFQEANKGLSYRGTVSRTEAGVSWVKWKDNRPNYFHYFEDHNFCRNPIANVHKPWCYTSVDRNDWKFCDIPYCDTDCFNQRTTYHGTVSTTKDGAPCVKWKDVVINSAGYLEDHNFCRNPRKSDKPWCYTSTTGVLYGYCNILSCALIRCKMYPYIDNMIGPPYRPDGYAYRENITITCQNGYYVDGTSSVQCGAMGKWITPLPLCKIKQLCPHFPKIENTNELSKTVEYRHLDTVTVTCQNGYEMRGSPVVECNAGIWSALPTCLGISCPKFPNIANTEQFNKTLGYRHPDTVIVTCRTGYEMTGSSLVRCSAGSWSELPTCLGKPCPQFPNIENTNELSKIVEYRHPATVTVTCKAGFEMTGSSVVECNAGKWSEQPTCLGISCPEFPNIENTIQLSKSVGYRHPDTVNVTCRTGYEINGSLVVQCYAGTWGALPTCFEVPTPSPLNAVPFAAGAVGLAVLFLVVVVVIIFLKRHLKPKKKQYVEREDQRNTTHISLDSSVIMYAEVKKRGNNKQYLNIDITDTDNGGYYDFSFGPQIPNNAIKTQDYYHYVETERGERGKIVTEFLKLRSGLQKPTTAALKPGNKMKNKYKDMYAYDESRVVLNKLDGSNNSDYINASFISGPIHIRKYIASQGPIDKTVDDFWRMVWQYDCGKIVMLTNVVEDGKQKCVQYWPVSEKEKINFGVINVVLLHEDVYIDFTVRRLEIQKDDEKKTVKQYHFTAWPDKDVPQYGSSLVYFRHKVNTSKVTASGPIIVHCSAGVGRTGTFIALDYVINQANEHGYVDVFACVDGLRNQRVNMVQTQRQYVFLHDAILEALMCPNSGIPAKDFPDTYKELLLFDNKKRKHNLQIEYEIMNKISPRHDKGVFEIGKSSENKRKNRYSNILPVGSEMPLLSTVVDGHNEYINAVFLPGYRNSKAFIISQMPLESTSTDLWRLVYDYKISTIIMLNQYNRTEDTYWPETAVPVSYGPFCIEKASSESAKGYKCLTLMMKYRKVQRRVKLFQSTFWDDDDMVPKSANDVFMFMKEIENSRDSSVDGPILVHCLNGCDKSGLYCVLATVIERLRIEQDVDIQYTIKQMRNRRPQIIPNYEQFQFLYEAVLEYQKQFETYSNFQ